MKGYVFYEEPQGTVFAAYDPVQSHRHDLTMVEGIGAAFDFANSPVCGASASAEYLASCKVISEERARTKHPRLFEALKEENE